MIDRKYLVTTSGRDLTKERVVMISSWGKSIWYCVGSTKIENQAFLANKKNSGVKIVESTVLLLNAARRVLVPPIWRKVISLSGTRPKRWRINREPKSAMLPKREIACLLPFNCSKVLISFCASSP